MRTDYGPHRSTTNRYYQWAKIAKKTKKMAKLVPYSVIDTKLRISKDSLDLV